MSDEPKQIVIERTPGEAKAYAQGMASSLLTDLYRQRDKAMAEVKCLSDQLKGMRECLCQDCRGEGVVDSGGQGPSGEWLNIPCGFCDGTGSLIKATDGLHARIKELEQEREKLLVSGAPVVWAVSWDNGRDIESEYVYDTEQAAREVAERNEAAVLPLCIAPNTLTSGEQKGQDDEGYAIRLFIDGERVLSHELDSSQAKTFAYTARHLLKYLEDEYDVERPKLRTGITPAERDGLRAIVDGIIRRGNGFVVGAGTDSARAVESILDRYTLADPPKPLKVRMVNCIFVEGTTDWHSWKLAEKMWIDAIREAGAEVGDG